MRLIDKLTAVKREVEFITTHDDASVAEVREALKNVRVIVDKAENQLVSRRLGSRTKRVINYLIGLWRAIRGR